MEQNFNNIQTVNIFNGHISIATPSCHCHCQDKEIIQNDMQLDHSNATAMYLLDLALNLMLQHVDCCRASGDDSYENNVVSFKLIYCLFCFANISYLFAIFSLQYFNHDKKTLQTVLTSFFIAYNYNKTTAENELIKNVSDVLDICLVLSFQWSKWLLSIHCISFSTIILFVRQVYQWSQYQTMICKSNIFSLLLI